MSKTISGSDLRDRLLARQHQPVPADAWMAVLGTPGHRLLLATIAHYAPKSIGELSALVDRAQPNVSRSLAALARAGLITIVVNGRSSVPTLTALGQEKAAEIGVPDLTGAAQAVADDQVDLVTDTKPFLVIAAHGADTVLLANVRSPKEAVVGQSREAHNEMAHRLIDHWWRIWCRRDAPFKVGDFDSEKVGAFTVLIASKGARIERSVRWTAEPDLKITSDFAGADAFQQELRQCVLEPMGKLAGRGGATFDELFLSKLTRLADSYEQTREHEFCRTAGALQLSPYGLSNEAAQAVRDLIAGMPEEDARLDFASTLDLEEVDTITTQLDQDVARLSGHNKLTALPDALADMNSKVSGIAAAAIFKPWQKGTAVAKLMRRRLQMGVDRPMGGIDHLAGLFGADDFILNEFGSDEILAFQSNAQDAPTMLVRSGWEEPYAAFFLARAIGDYLVFQSKKSCVSNKYTDRQAVGRAFAAEFMAPAAGVIAMIDEEELSMTKVAAHYGVSEDVVRHQYENNY
ncbi:hypothetical protein V1318_04335 [Lysobacter sp. CCNWLW3]|uniref:HVO_A0114 family putative DNA-binding protein n=1 Tax=unclassified Lysobacter TaxID=2635362 RepID=UPI002FD45EB5